MAGMMMGNYGAVISFKSEWPLCLERRQLVREFPNYAEEAFEDEEDRAWFTSRVAHDDDTCNCDPGLKGFVWSEVMKAIGPHGIAPWSMTEEMRERYIQEDLMDAERDAQRYHAYMRTHGDLM